MGNFLNSKGDGRLFWWHLNIFLEMMPNWSQKERKKVGRAHTLLGCECVLALADREREREGYRNPMKPISCVTVR